MDESKKVDVGDEPATQAVYRTGRFGVFFVYGIPFILLGPFAALAEVPVLAVSSFLFLLLLWQVATRKLTVEGDRAVLDRTLTRATIELSSVSSVVATARGYSVRGYGWEINVADFADGAPGLSGATDEERVARITGIFMPAKSETRGRDRAVPSYSARLPSVAATGVFVGACVATFFVSAF